jgi:hypothetical protein
VSKWLSVTDCQLPVPIFVGGPQHLRAHDFVTVRSDFFLSMHGFIHISAYDLCIPVTEMLSYELQHYRLQPLRPFRQRDAIFVSCARIHMARELLHFHAIFSTLCATWFSSSAAWLEFEPTCIGTLITHFQNQNCVVSAMLREQHLRTIALKRAYGECDKLEQNGVCNASACKGKALCSSQSKLKRRVSSYYRDVILMSFAAVIVCDSSCCPNFLIVSDPISYRFRFIPGAINSGDIKSEHL